MPLASRAKRQFGNGQLLLGKSSLAQTAFYFEGSTRKYMSKHIQKFYENVYVAGTEIPRASKLYTIDCVPTGGNLRVLDVGCGSGMNAMGIAAKGHRLHGIDISEAAIQKYRDHGFEGSVCDLETGLDFPDASFDLVFCSEVIEHMTAPELLASEMSRVLKPNGLLVLSTPNSAFWVYRLFSVLGYTLSEVQHPKHFHFFSRRSLLKLLRGVGFVPRQLSGLNMYMLLPDVSATIKPLLSALGFQRQIRFRTGRYFWHLSSKSSMFNSFFAETLIVVMQKQA